MPLNRNIINPADEANIPDQPISNEVSAPPAKMSQIINPADEVPEIPIEEAPQVKADIQMVPQKPIDSSFLGRAKLSLERDKTEAQLYSQQMQAGDVGLGNQILTAITHPIMFSMAKSGQPKITKEEATNLLQQGAAARRLEGINQDFSQMPQASWKNPIDWASQAISDNVLASAGLGAGLTATLLFKQKIPSILGAVAVGMAGSAVTGAIGRTFNSEVIEKPTKPNNPDDPFYSRKNQASLANLNAWQDAGGLVGGGIGGGIGQKIATPNAALRNKVINEAGTLLNDTYEGNSNQASALLRTARGLDIDIKDLPNNPDEFVPNQIVDLQKRVQKVMGNAEEVKQNNIINEAILRDKAPATTTEFAKNATGQADTQRQANSAVTDTAFKNVLYTQRDALNPYYKMIDKYGFLQEETDKVNNTVKEVVQQLSDKNLIGTLYGNNALSMNYVTKGLASHAEGIANAGPEIIDSVLDSLSTTIKRDPTGTAGIAAQQAYKQLYPVVQEAKTNSIKTHLTSSRIMGGNALSDTEADKLASNINGAYSGKGQQQNAFTAMGGIASPENAYGSEMPAGYVSNRDFYNKYFAPNSDDITGYNYNDYLGKVTKNMFSNVTDFGNKLVNSSDHIKSVMETPEYIKAFGGNTFGRDNLSYQEQKDALNSTLSNASNALQITLGDGIKSGVFPDAMNNATREGLQRVLARGEVNQRNLGAWMSGNPDAADILFKFNKAGIEGHKTYQEILRDITAPDKFPVSAKVKALEYIKDQENLGDYENLVDSATNNFTNDITDLISSGNPQNGAKVIDLANQYKSIFGNDADPILTNAYRRLGLNAVNGDKELVSKVRDLIGNNTEVSKKFVNQIEKVQRQLIKETVNDEQRAFLMKVASNPFNILKIAMDSVSRVVNDLPLMPKVGEKGLDKAIGDSLLSRANYEAAKTKADQEQIMTKYNRLMNVFIGGQAGK